ncbi:uncharacterized protein LOC115797849 [Archocentrus centrarchus]|uniref:uncharacterized protein LOC115797849 n=1 Tax=Archocentrus centrarchus TaxID=63155 RepID=UPI0011E9B81C|nr:uncharacterized protein LOC115797849 [Archocentrus centrarchus]
MARKTADRNKARFDKQVVESTLEAGDRVLVRNVRLRGKNKLADKWESDVYIVVRQSGDIPVYVVRPETKDGPLRTLHRDLLLPCGFLSATSAEIENPVKEKPRRPKTRQYSRTDNSDHSEERESDSGDSYPFLYGYRDIMVETADPRHTPVVGPSLMVGSTPEPPHVPVVEQASDVVPHCTTPRATAVTNLPNVSLEDSTLHKLSSLEVNPPETNPVENDTLGTDSDERTFPGQDAETHSQSEEDRVSTPPDTNHDETRQTDHTGDCDNDYLRRSTRRRVPAQRLTYPELGNPLVTVVQSLFHSLSAVITDSLNEPTQSRVLTV